MKTIQIKIDAGDKHCGNCEHIKHVPYQHCSVFDSYGSAFGGDMPRAKECLEAEVKPVGEIK